MSERRHDPWSLVANEDNGYGVWEYPRETPSEQLALQHGRFPWIPPTVLNRPVLQRWFAYYAQVPLRYVWGPCGFGKTTSAILYARAGERTVGYVRVPPAADVATFLGACAPIANERLRSLDELTSELTRAGVAELIVDGIDAAAAPLRAELDRVPYAVEADLRFIYLARARNAIDVLPAVTSGAAAILDSRALAFGASEIAAIADRLGVPYADGDVTRLAETTDGWPFVVSAVIREAAADARPLTDAYEHWQQRHARLLGDLAARSLDGLDADDYPVAEAFYAGRTALGDAELERLADHGLLVAPGDDARRPLRPLVDAIARGAVVARFERGAAEPRGTAEIEMFGAFSMTIDGRTVSWARRRDRQFIQYLALAEGGRASREELIATFWPGADAASAARSLRSTCSTIRRAIATCTGPHRVEEFFTADRHLALRFERVTPTTRRFEAEMRSAEDALQREDLRAAELHLAAALRLYRAPLLAAEPPAPWMEGHAARFARLAQRAHQAVERVAVPPLAAR